MPAPARTMFRFDVDQTTVQVLVGFDRCGVIAVFPKRPMPVLALVVFLRRSPGDQLHAPGDNVFAGILRQKVDVIGRRHVAEQTQSVPTKQRFRS